MLGFIKKFRQMSLAATVLLTTVYYANADNIAVVDDNVAVAYADESEVFVGHQGSKHTAQNLARCSQHFYGGTPPTFVGEKGQKLARENYELCFDGFGILYSGISRTPIYSASHLTKSRIDQARALTRKDSFHEEMRLPVHARAMLSDYRRSNYDRGHLSPNGDMANASQQFDSFSLANIAPQNNEHNRGVWQDIEKNVRNLTVKYGELYVVTGVVFSGEKVVSIGSGVLVPTHFFKAVYIPKLNRAGVYYAPNNNTGELEYISLSELTARTGIDAMPRVSMQAQSSSFELSSVLDVYQGKESQDEFWLAVVRPIVEFIMKLLA